MSPVNVRFGAIAITAILITCIPNIGACDSEKDATAWKTRAFFLGYSPVGDEVFACTKEVELLTIDAMTGRRKSLMRLPGAAQLRLLSLGNSSLSPDSRCLLIESPKAGGESVFLRTVGKSVGNLVDVFESGYCDFHLNNGGSRCYVLTRDNLSCTSFVEKSRLWTIPVKPPMYAPRFIAVSADESVLAAAFASSLYSIDAKTGHVRASRKLHMSDVRFLAVDRSGKTVVLVGDRTRDPLVGTVHLLNARDLTEQQRYEYTGSQKDESSFTASVSADFSTVAVATYSVNSQRTTIRILSPTKGWARDVVKIGDACIVLVSPNGSQLVAYGEETARCYSVRPQIAELWHWDYRITEGEVSRPDRNHY